MAKRKKTKAVTVVKPKTRYITRAAQAIKRRAKPTKQGFTDILISGALAAGGGIAAGIISQKIPMPNQKLKPLIPIAAGLLLGASDFGKGKHGKSVAIGMVAAGTLAFAKTTLNLPVLAGDDQDYEYYGEEDFNDDDLMGIDEDDLNYYGDYQNYDGDYDNYSGSNWKTNY